MGFWSPTSFQHKFRLNNCLKPLTGSNIALYSGYGPIAAQPDPRHGPASGSREEKKSPQEKIFPTLFPQIKFQNHLTKLAEFDVLSECSESCNFGTQIL